MWEWIFTIDRWVVRVTIDVSPSIFTRSDTFEHFISVNLLISVVITFGHDNFIDIRINIITIV